MFLNTEIFGFQSYKMWCSPT